MKKILIFTVAFLSLVSCQSLKEEFQPVFTGEYDKPAVNKPVTMAATHTIDELAAMYETGKPWTIDKNIVISGIVSTTDRYGNFYKSFYIQDETGGMEIKLGKNGLYNDYLPGQRIYVDCNGLELGMYGYKDNSGNGMVQIGFNNGEDDTYETSYIESSILIDTHVFKGEIEGEVEPVVIDADDLPGANDTQATNQYIGKLVTIKNLYYTWYDTKYEELQEAFALLYLDSNQDKKASKNRIFISGEDTGITTWAMSEEKMDEHLTSGIWDGVLIGNANDQNYGSVGDYKDKINPVNGQPYYGIERAPASVSQYFSTMPEGAGTCVQIRTSGYCRFADTEVRQEVLDGTMSINVTGILTLYQGKVQITVNNITDIEYND
ncbi:MAG: hypothetical protein IAB78_08595 [Bacteroidetes bacterium]|uniref:DUF5689 domain-containing protein n=1 Tax=Candidatus Cryptobacteroides excrementavium TaxID=2840759 RepID=A0A9D9J4H8_9BACT|nr:hypothetical protein [Candidatus Cryptobacteroides excrementavium]